MLTAAEENYENAKATMHPEDPRMKTRESALWTWVLKVLGMIEKLGTSPKVKLLLEQLGEKAPWKQLHGLLLKPKKQELNNAEWTSYGNLHEECGSMFVNTRFRRTCAFWRTTGLMPCCWKSCG